MNKNFCSLPWVGLDVNTQGGIKPCCKYRDVVSTDIKQYLQSQHLHDLRQQFLRGERPTGCQRCWNDEDAGLASKRQIDHAYTFGGQDPDLSSLKIITMGFGNTCNLACMTCSSMASSRWATDEKKIDPKLRKNPIYAHSRHYREPDFLKALSAITDDVIHLEIPGGEPFYAPKDVHLQFLRSFKNPSNIKIHYTTNATIFPDSEFWSEWKKFRHVDIQLSIDGIEDRFQYLRYPADWVEVYNNIKRYQSVSDIQLSLSHTVSWMNVLYIDDFLHWCQAEGLPAPYIGPVSIPRFLSVKALPSYAKESIQKHLGTSQREETQNILRYMNQEDWSLEFGRAKDWISSVDLIRNKSFAHIFPELNGLIQNQ